MLYVGEQKKKNIAVERRRHVFGSASGVLGDIVASESAPVSCGCGELDLDTGGVVGSRAMSGDSGDGRPAATSSGALARSTRGSS